MKRRRRRADGTYSDEESYHSDQDEEGKKRRQKRRQQRKAVALKEQKKNYDKGKRRDGKSTSRTSVQVTIRVKHIFLMVEATASETEGNLNFHCI